MPEPDITEIRDEYQDAADQWAPIRDERKTDLRYVAGDPWDPKARRLREDANRPIITADELGQYVNQIINGVRQNKRAIKVTQETSGATDKTAEFRQNLIRQIEYKSNAQQGAYTCMFENAVQGSYGFLRIQPRYEHHRSFDQELRIESIPNPDLVTPDPYGVLPDGSDWKFLYLSEGWRKRDFERRWPTAKVRDFTTDEISDAGAWLRGDRIMVAERWRLETRKRKLLLVQPSAAPGQPAPQPITLFEDELEQMPVGRTVIRDREVDYPYVTQQITNGLEILEETQWPGTSIPFVPCYGKVLYVDAGKGAERKILSAVRLARDPYMLYCYYRTQQAEMAGMIPKTPVVGYKGQFAGNEQAWQKAPHEPVAYLEVLPTIEGVPPGTILPLPQRIAYEAGAHLAALELCAEGARRAIQAAMGISPLPTDAQRVNQKSGKALERIEESGDRGSFHFIDHYDASITRTGAILDELIPIYYETARQVTVRKPDDQPIQVRINDDQAPEPIDATAGQHDVTISVGPAYKSEREAASDFADTIIASPMVQMFGPKAPELLALAIRLKAVGPIGDEMADLLSPPKPDQPPSPQQVAEMQTQIQALSQQLQAAALELKTDAAKQQAQIAIAKINAAKDLALQRMKDATTIRAAEIAATKQVVADATEDQTEAIALALEQSHEAMQAELDRQHERELAVQTHQQGLEAGAQGADLAMQQAEHQQAITPPQEPTQA